MPFPFSIAETFEGSFEINEIRKWLKELRSRFEAPSINLTLIFVSPKFSEHSGLLLSLINDELDSDLVVGCTSSSLISNGTEFEGNEGFSIGLFHLPDTQLKATYFNQKDVEQGEDADHWRQRTETTEPNGWIVVADPFNMDLEEWLRQWNRTFPDVPILGGLASGPLGNNQTEIYLDDQVYTAGGIAIAIQGAIQLRSVISQGCTPIGEPWTVTHANRNVLEQIGNRPAYEVLVETANQLPPVQAAQVQGNLFVGLVINEYADEFKRGDFLIRNLLGADPESGKLAIGALPRPGQTVQFQLRSPEAASEDLRSLLAEAATQFENEEIIGGLLCTCNGRGKRLFGRPSHDADTIHQFFDQIPLVGFFCNGELGPVARQNFLHGYTASLALFTRPTTRE